MKLKLSLIAAMLAVATLSACGGSDDKDVSPPPMAYPVASPAALTKTDTAPGTGPEAVAGKTVKLHYTGYLYSDTAPGNKGRQFETSVGRDPLVFQVGGPRIITGMSQGVTGMLAGGKRTIAIPASLAYGATGSGPIPPNSGVVFDLELLEVQ